MIEGSTPWPPDVAARYRAAGLWEGRTIAEVVAASASVRRDKVAVVDGERTVTYAQLVAAGRPAGRAAEARRARSPATAS